MRHVESFFQGHLNLTVIPCTTFGPILVTFALKRQKKGRRLRDSTRYERGVISHNISGFFGPQTFMTTSKTSQHEPSDNLADSKVPISFIRQIVRRKSLGYVLAIYVTLQLILYFPVLKLTMSNAKLTTISLLQIARQIKCNTTGRHPISIARQPR